MRTISVIGIDEAGRGPLAGPVVVGGIRLKVNSVRGPHLKYGSHQWKFASNGVKSEKFKVFENIRDSKKLSAKQLGEWFSLLTAHPAIDWAFAKVWPKVIDRINITQATNLGVERVYAKLSFGGKRSGSEHRVLLDGSLELPSEIPHEVIVKGDEKVPIVAAASIIAKVVRDKTMLRLHKKYPQYRFDIHKGYGTKLHKSLIKQFGISEVHRKSFKIRDKEPD